MLGFRCEIFSCWAATRDVIESLGLYSTASIYCSAVPVPEVEDLESNTHRCKYTPDRYRSEAVVRESPPHENSGNNERDPRGIGAPNIQHVSSLVQFTFRSP